MYFRVLEFCYVVLFNYLFLETYGYHLFMFSQIDVNYSENCHFI